MAREIQIEMLEARTDKDYLILSYRVTNRSDQAIYLFTPLTELTESGVVADPNKVYAFLDMDGALQITKRVWSVPEEVDIYEPLMPRLTRVEVGQKFQERLALRLPVRIDYPYRFAGEDELHVKYDLVTDQSNGVTASVGYVRAHYVAIASKGSEEHSIEHGTACLRQEMLQATVIKSTIQVQDVDINGQEM